MMRHILLISQLLLLCGCNVADRLSRVGIPPEMNAVAIHEPLNQDPQFKDDASEVNILESESEFVASNTANSLWRPGARTFFRDQRARSIGDILKVAVSISDSAKLDNQTTTSRNDTGSMGMPHALGLENLTGKFLPDALDLSNAINVKSADSNKGIGKVDRKEDINTTIAATVIKILPSNNLVIKGSQEIRVNNEIREITVEGIVRPEDISAQNTVTLDQIAEARVSYGGRGNISDYQQPRYGKQMIDAIAPF